MQNLYSQEARDKDRMIQQFCSSSAGKRAAFLSEVVSLRCDNPEENEVFDKFVKKEANSLERGRFYRHIGQCIGCHGAYSKLLRLTTN